MEKHTRIYKEFIKEYIKSHSPLNLKEKVRIIMFHSSHEYEISKIVVDSEGEFNFEVTSPRTHSTLPNLFRAKDLEKIQ
jgi:hypothetical protein